MIYDKCSLGCNLILTASDCSDESNYEQSMSVPSVRTQLLCHSQKC